MQTPRSPSSNTTVLAGPVGTGMMKGVRLVSRRFSGWFSFELCFVFWSSSQNTLFYDAKTLKTAGATLVLPQESTRVNLGSTEATEISRFLHC